MKNRRAPCCASSFNPWRLASVALAIGLLSACGGGDSAAPDVPKWPVSGITKGLPAGNSLVLQSNWGESLTVAADGPFAFSIPQPGGTAYVVSIKTGPEGFQCTVPNGLGTMPSAALDSLSVRCTVPGALPVGHWEQAVCSPTNAFGTTRKALRNLIYDAKLDPSGVSYFASAALYANADCSGERQEFGAGKPLARSFVTARTHVTAKMTAYWGESNAGGMGIYDPLTTIMVRQDTQLCIFERIVITDFPDAASLEAQVSAAIADGKCYTAR